MKDFRRILTILEGFFSFDPFFKILAGSFPFFGVGGGGWVGFFHIVKDSCRIPNDP